MGRFSQDGNYSPDSNFDTYLGTPDTSSSPDTSGGSYQASVAPVAPPVTDNGSSSGSSNTGFAPLVTAGPTSANANPSGDFFSNKPSDQNLGPQASPQGPVTPQQQQQSQQQQAGLSPYDWLLNALNSGQYSNPQDAINAMNGQSTAGYNGYAAYYPGNGTIGIPPGGQAGQYGGYFTKGPNGQWGYVAHNGPEGGGGGGGAGTYNISSGGGTTGFADPAYEALNQLANSISAELQKPIDFPQLDTLMSQLQAQQAVTKAAGQSLADTYNTRAGQLQQPLLSLPQTTQQQALAENNLLASRDAAIQNVKDSLAARGINPNQPGIGEDQIRQIQQNAGNQEAQIQAQLAQGNIQSDEQRRNEATQLQALANQAVQGGDLQAIQQQAQMADLENQLYQTNQQRQFQALAAQQIPVDLTNQGYTNASSALTSPVSALNALTSLVGGALNPLNNQAFNQANSQASGLSQLIQNALNALNL